MKSFRCSAISAGLCISNEGSVKAGRTCAQLRRSPTPATLGDGAPWLDRPQEDQDDEPRLWDPAVPTISPTSSVASYDDDAAAAASGAAGVDLVMLCQQFHNLEQQQCTIMEMLQVTSYPVWNIFHGCHHMHGHHIQGNIVMQVFCAHDCFDSYP